jgi:hypothetical protein
MNSPSCHSWRNRKQTGAANEGNESALSASKVNTLLTNRARVALLKVLRE